MTSHEKEHTKPDAKQVISAATFVLHLFAVIRFLTSKYSKYPSDIKGGVSLNANGANCSGLKLCDNDGHDGCVPGPRNAAGTNISLNGFVEIPVFDIHKYGCDLETVGCIQTNHYYGVTSQMVESATGNMGMEHSQTCEDGPGYCCLSSAAVKGDLNIKAKKPLHLNFVFGVRNVSCLEPCWSKHCGDGMDDSPVALAEHVQKSIRAYGAVGVVVKSKLLDEITLFNTDISSYDWDKESDYKNYEHKNVSTLGWRFKFGENLKNLMVFLPFRPWEAITGGKVEDHSGEKKCTEENIALGLSLPLKHVECLPGKNPGLGISLSVPLSQKLKIITDKDGHLKAWQKILLALQYPLGVSVSFFGDLEHASTLACFHPLPCKAIA